jgi:hypothetical protein
MSAMEPQMNDDLVKNEMRFSRDRISSSSLLKNQEIGAFPVFLPWGLGRSGCCEQTRTYAASSLGMRIRL